MKAARQLWFCETVKSTRNRSQNSVSDEILTIIFPKHVSYSIYVHNFWSKCRDLTIIFHESVQNLGFYV